MKITFFGAAQNVTGSKHLIGSNGYNLLLDCGLYQGHRKESDKLNSQPPFSPDTINAVILSHAHLDHCGTLPVLVKNGFKGKIYCTLATAEIAKYILLDSAKIQEQDAEYLNRHLKAGENEIISIYTEDDVKKTVSLFEPVDYFWQSQKWTQLNKNIKFKLYDAGHILGSVVIFLEIKEGESVKTLAFTGDLGREDSPILRSPENIQEWAQTLITECTYGDRLHQPIKEAAGGLKNAVGAVIKSKGKIILPAFSLGRTQEIIYILHKLIDQKEIPPIPIYIDSPLAINITDIFPKYKNDFDADFWKDFGNKGESPFITKNLHYVRTVKESKGLNKKRGPMIIISASGMLEGGRVVHHIKNNIDNPQNIILLAGYQAENTLGRKIQDGVSPVRIFGKEHQVRAQVKTLNEFSAHADQKDLLSYISRINGLQKIFLVHAEPHQSAVFKNLLIKNFPSLLVKIPTTGQSFEI